MLQLQAGDWSRGAVCLGDSSLGALTIPREVLERMPDGTSFQPLALALSTVAAGDFDVSLYVGMALQDSNGAALGVTLPSPLPPGGTAGTGS